MKNRSFILALLIFSAVPAGARENSYDVLGKVLAPFAALLVNGSKHAARSVTADIALAEMTGLPPEFAGLRLNIALEPPDKLCVRGPVLGEPMVICRAGQEVWGAPRAKLDPLLALLPATDAPGVAEKLGNFVLPVPEKQLVFLPALFQVRDAGDASLNGIDCRLLDVTLMPELARAPEAVGWSARLWVRPDYKPARLELARPGWRIALVFETFEYAPSLPASAWQPAPAGEGDVLRLDATGVRRILNAVFRGKLPRAQ